MRNILYIHGAFGSSGAFQFLMNHLPSHNQLKFDYDINKSPEEVVLEVGAIIEDIDSLNIISHSLGGLIAVGAAINHSKINSVVTLSTPFGGNWLAEIVRIFNSHHLYDSLGSSSSLLKTIRKTKPAGKVFSIITTVGNNPFLFGRNDGVVTVRSQQSIGYSQKAYFPLNHFEVLHSMNVANQIRNWVFE